MVHRLWQVLPLTLASPRRAAAAVAVAGVNTIHNSGLQSNNTGCTS